MEAVVQYQLPGSEFWDDYRKLWQKSMHPSVFQAPAFIRNLCQYKKSKIAIITFKQENEIVGAAFFQKEKGVFRFISDQKTDHNFFVLHQSCTKEQLKRLFKAFLQTVREENWALALNNMASWADYWEVFQNALKESSLFKVSFSYSVCPVLEAISPEALASKLTKSRNTRYKKNRLQKEWGITFEALTGEEHLEEWITEFANAHEQRWSATNTPSGYRSKDRRAFLKSCLKAWIEDDILVRFSLKTEEKRIAFCIGLKEGKALIHHSHTYDSSFSQYSPGKVLLGYIGKWMGDNGFSKLDFGDGDEDFKYNYTDTELSLNRVFIASHARLFFILKVRLIKWIRHQPEFFRLYRKNLRPLFLKIRNI